MRYPSSSAASKSFEVDEFAVVDLVRLDDLVGRDLASLLLADLLVPDRRAVLLVDEVELEIVLVDRAVHLHGGIDEPESDAPRPDRTRHMKRCTRRLGGSKRTRRAVSLLNQ